MNIFNNNQANNNKNIFNTNQSRQQQQPPGQQTTGINIFANTMNKNVNPMSSNNPQQAVNLFTQQKPTQQQPQQQQTQSQTQNLLSTNNPSRTNPQQAIPQNPLIADSLYQKQSFSKILQKVLGRQKLAMQEINFVKHHGQVYFKQDKWKTNHFKNVICKKDYLGFGPQEIIIKGDIPKCQQIDSIFATIIRNFASICETHQMNGYFMIKQLIKSTGIYTKFYQPKAGLDNKVFEVNQKFLKLFYKPSISTQQQQQKFIIDKEGKIYLQLLNQLITQFDKQWNSYLKIVQVVCCNAIDGDEEDQMDRNVGGEENMGRQSRSQGQQSPQRQMTMSQKSLGQASLRTRHLRFTEFLQTNILLSLFQSYKAFSFHQYEAQLKNSTEEMSPSRKRYHKMKKLLFFRISQLMSGILQCLYSQQMLLQKDPLPIIQVARFIDTDIQIVHSASLIQPIHEQRYIKNGMNIILAIVPFAAFINQQHCQLLRIYFNQPQIIQKYNKSMSTDYKNGILKMLSQLQTPMFMPIKLWALTQIQHMKIMQKFSNNNNTRHNRIHNQYQNKQLRQQQIIHLTTLWQEYLQKNIKDLTILQQQRWSYLLCTMILTLGIKNMLQSQFLKSILVYYTKNLLKNNACRFFNLQNEILAMQKSVSYEELQDMVVTQNQHDKKQLLLRLSKMVIGQFSMFVAGRVFQQILNQDIVDDSFRLMTKLLRDQQQRESNFTKYLFKFVDAVKDDYDQEQHGNNNNIQPINPNILSNSSLRIKIFIAQIARQLKLPLFSAKNPQNLSQLQASVLQVPKQQIQAITCFEQEIKFICKLIQVNFTRLQYIENKLFGDMENVVKQRMMKQSPYNNRSSQSISQTQGLKTCIFLCMILGRINLHQVNNIKCTRYIIQTIDTLFNYQQTNKLMIFAISIVFPLDRRNSLLTINDLNRGDNVRLNNSYFSQPTRYSDEFQGMYSFERVLVVLRQQRMTQGQQRRQIQKLHHVVSHHLNHLIKYTDSVDIPFPINTSTSTYYKLENNRSISTHTIYQKIQKQLTHWQFPTACQYMNSSMLTYRPSQWLYTLVNVLKCKQMLPVDIDTIILVMSKLRIPTEESPAFLCMMEILRTVNEVNILEQLLVCLKPTIIVERNKQRKQQQISLQQHMNNIDKQNKKKTIINQQLSTYQPTQQHSQQQFPRQKYNKYENTKIVQNKNKKYIFNEQSLMIRKVCMFVRLVEEVLKAKLQLEYESYVLLTRMEVVDQLFRMLVNQQDLYAYNIEYIENNQERKEQSINLHCVIVSLLNLYNYQLVLPITYNSNLNTKYYLLRQIQKHAFFTFSYERKYANNIVMYQISSATNNMLLCYQQQASIVNSMFFQSVPYMANDFGVENDQVSLKSSVISIVQLLCQHQHEGNRSLLGHSGQLVTKCLQNYSYPLTQQKLPLLTFNPTLKYLKHDRQQSLIPLLFSHIKQTITSSSMDTHIIKQLYSRKLQLLSRTLQTLSVLIEQDMFFNEVIHILTDLRIEFGNLLLMLNNSHEILRREVKQSTLVNVYNKLVLFIYRLVDITITRHSQYIQQVVNNFLIKPTNLLRMVFQCIDKLKPNNVNLMDSQKLQLVKSFQSMPNYLMQQRLTKLTLYRVTVDALCRIFMCVVQIVESKDIGQLMVWLFKLTAIIVQKPIQLGERQQQQDTLMLTRLNLIPLQKLIISKQPQQNIKTTTLSQQVTEYKYTYRTNIRKYGNNFMYSSHVAFHRLKIYYSSILQKYMQQQQQYNNNYFNNNNIIYRLQHVQFVRRQLYHIQLINCLKSVKFSTDSMVKSYFQLMNLLSNIGLMGQNLSCLEIQRQLPIVHQQKILFNKYCLENRFSFFNALIGIKPLLSRDESLAKIVADFVTVLLEYVSQKDDKQVEMEQLTRRQQHNQHQQNSSLPLLTTTLFQQQLTKKQSQHFNNDHIIKLISNILSTTVEYYFHSEKVTLTQSIIQPLGGIIKKVINGLRDKKVHCTLRVMLMAYENMLVICEKLVLVERERVMVRKYGGGININNNKRIMQQQQQQQQQQSNINNINNTTQIHYYQPSQQTKLSQLNEQLQEQVLQSIRQILYKSLQKQKPTLYLKEYIGIAGKSSSTSLFGNTHNGNNNITNNNSNFMEISQYNSRDSSYSTFSKQQLMQNVSVICAVSMVVLQTMWRNKVVNNREVQSSHKDNNIRQTPYTIQYINYIIKLLVENIQQITNPITRIVLFNLCNKFYITNQQTLVEKWPFYNIHVNVCDELLLGNKYNGFKQDELLLGNLNNNNGFKLLGNKYNYQKQDDDDDYFNNNYNGQQNNDPFWMEKINVIDTYSTLAIVNQKLFTKQLLTILTTVINIDVDFIKRQKTTIGGKEKRGMNQRDFITTTANVATNIKKKYNLRKSSTMGITIDKLIQYKKLLTAILLTFGQQNWLNPNYSPQTNVLFLQVLNFMAIEFKLQRLLPIRKVENRLKGLIVCEGQGQQERLRKVMIERQRQRQRQEKQIMVKKQTVLNSLGKSIKSNLLSNKYIYNKNQTFQKHPYNYHQHPYNYYQPYYNHPQKSSSTSNSLSLFEFTAFVHHNQLIYTWLLATKMGLRQSSIMHEIGGYILQTQTYNQIWTSMITKINQLYHYYADYVELFVQNSLLINNLTKLYNYIAQQSAYMVEFDGLTVYFDLLEDDYVQTQLVRGIIEYSVVVIQTVRKCRDIEWKCQRNWGKERSACINKCLQLIQKNKVIIGFKQLGLWGKQYNDLRQTLNEELERQRNFRRD